MNIELKDSELDYIVKVLCQRPWTEVNALLINIQQQVSLQQPNNKKDVDPSLGDHDGS